MCRSPLLEVLLDAALRARGVAADVHSMGVWRDGQPAAESSVHEAAKRGLALDHHRSRLLDPLAVERADLVIALAREHVREVAALVPSAFPRTFTLKELVRGGEAFGARLPDEPLPDWLAAVTQTLGRRPATYLRSDPADDVIDPIGAPAAVHAATATELEDLAVRLAALLVPIEASASVDTGVAPGADPRLHPSPDRP